VAAYDDAQPKSTMFTENGRLVPQAWVTALPNLEPSVRGYSHKPTQRFQASSFVAEQTLTVSGQSSVSGRSASVPVQCQTLMTDLQPLSVCLSVCLPVCLPFLSSIYLCAGNLI